MNSPSEERVMRAREAMAIKLAARATRLEEEQGEWTWMDLATVALECSGIGELLSAIDAWIADGTPETEQGILDARAALSQSS